MTPATRAPEISRFATDEFEEMAEAWEARGWDARYRQLEGGRFEGSLLHTADGPRAAYRGRWRCGIQHHGLQPKGAVTLAVTLAQEGVGRFNGVELGSSSVIVQTEAFELIGPTFWDAAVLTLPEDAFASELAAVTQEDPPGSLQGVHALDPQRVARIRHASLEYFAAVEQVLASPGTELPLREMSRDLASQVISALGAAGPHPRGEPRLRRCREIVRETEAYAESCGAGPLRSAEVCGVLGVSERTLRYAFAKLLGKSPAAYLKTLRLNRVHHALRRADPQRTMVKQVAYDHGFWHLGQLSRDYAGQFGELPSETLAR